MLIACGEKSVDSHGTSGDVEEDEVCREAEIGQKDSGESEFEPEISEQPEQDLDMADEGAALRVSGDAMDEASWETEDYAAGNEERFYECAEMLEIDCAEAERRYQRLCDDNVFQNHTARLIGVDIEDLDQNGQTDMVVMVADAEYNYYGEGCIYFYMNEDEAYCFRDEEYPFFFGFNLVPGDFDNDGNTEIAFESLGSGVGGAGDWHPRILKYKDHTLEPMVFPADDYDGRGIRIVITQEEKWDTYSACCAYMNETLVFEAENKMDPDASQPCGGNSRGYFNLWRGEYEGRDALEVSEYLYGEGGTMHFLGLAKFLIVWDENGDGQIVKWWVEPH